MRSANIVRALSVTAAAVALIVACGSEDSSTFVDPNAIDSGPSSSSSSSGGFNNVDSGQVDANGVDPNCKPLTCAEQGIECGPAGDGCGGLIQDCGKCADGKRCGGPNALSKCVDPNVGTVCTPKTCAQLGVECGPAGDGCGGIIADCGKCTAPGTQCGDNNTPSKCVAIGPLGPDGGACVPRDCSFYTAQGFNCGKQSDGCGGELTCGTCTVQGEFCGGGGPNVCGNPVSCVKKTCANYPVGTCGQQSDDCGSLTANCGLCTVPGEICGGGGTPSKCGGGSVLGPDGGACIPKTTCGANECGDIADGCGGVLSCGTGNCTGTNICGGAGTPNQCGTPNCVKNPATQAAACAGKNCGVVSDGCGGTWSCGGPNACGDAGAICGGGGVPNVCGGGTVTGPDGGTCTPKTAAACTAGQCGSFPNGCGGLYDCGGCAAGTGECGGDPLKGPGVCGGGTQCTPLSKTAACGSQTCGYAADGCGPTSSNGNNGYWACGNNNGSCPTGQSCGIFTPNQCGSLSGPCINDTTTTCTSNTQCCSGLCGALGKCVQNLPDGGAPSCLNIGQSCLTGNQCCSGSCSGGVCATSNGGACKAQGSTCSAHGECCSKGCINGKCSLATSFCRQVNEVCTQNSQCCGGACVGATGTTAGKCAVTDPAGGQDSCIVAGTVVSDCSTTSATTYVCNAGCCSGSCSGNDSTSPFAICQLSPGCRVLGELCTADSQCCNDGTNKSSKCNTQNGQPPSATNIGRCNGEQACNKPGQVCKTATDSCSFSNNCCVPPDLQGVLNNCSSDPDKCCRHDNQGVPRCTGFGICHNPGGTCTGSQDCCPLTPGGTPPPCSNGICQPDVCISDPTKPCTVDKDCCNGNCFKQNATDFTGFCKIPTCTKKTCASYPANTCGYQSDGCGDVIRDQNGNPLDCHPCTPPQTCGGGAGGSPGVCGGSICTPLTVCPAGYECGQYPDGCGGLVQCGGCPKPGGDPADTCGGGGQPNKCGHPTCTPLNCAQQGIQCGQTGNGCGQVINCPPCDPGLTCGGGGTPNQCGAPACTPKSCAQLGIECGDAPNGCGGTTTCPPCPDPTETCGGGGAPNICGKATCTSKTCAQQYPTGIKNCGDISNLCGGTTNCGVCPQGQTCVDNECIGTACVPKTCMQLGVECGQVADGCGGLTPECGPCPAGTGCGAGGTPNKCAPAPCTPKTCQDLGAVCGQIANGCGGLTPSCGDCGGNLACKNGACVQACTPRTCTEADAQCGYIADGCGGVVDCGLCPDGFTCGFGGQANKCGRSQPN